ncbi:MAG: hypothetical protein AB7V04_07560 [Desulfomonilaceae bacterium]
MKRVLLIGLFVFSLLLNLTVAAIVGWYYWVDRSRVFAPVADCPILDEADHKKISQTWNDQSRSRIRETRRLLREKQAELIDQIAKTPGDISQAEEKLRELMILREKLEREVLGRLSNALIQLPEDKRGALVQYVKNRSCMGPGMRFKGRMGKGCAFEQDVEQDNSPKAQ